MRIRVLLRAAFLLAMVAASPTAFCATVTWDAGGGNQLWSNAANWDTDSLPMSTDDVVITNATSIDTVLLDLNATVQSINVGNGVTFHVQAGWVLTVDGPSTSIVDPGGELVLDGAFPTGGSLSGNGALSVDGTFGVHGNCTLGGSGAVTINSGGEMEVGSVGAGNVISISRDITNNTGGTITFLNTSVVDTTFNGVTIDNSGIIDVQNDQNLSGTATINNNNGGLIRKSVGAGPTEIYFTVNNAAGATIDVQSGTLRLDDGGTVSGAYLISPSAIILLKAGTFTMSGSPTVTGAGLLLIDGTLDVGVGVTFTNVELRSGGMITGAGAVTVSGTFTWRGGTIAGSGPKVLDSTSAPIFFCNVDCVLDGAALQLQASATHSAVINALVLSNGASLTIDPGKTLGVTSIGNISSGGGSASSIINNGTIWKQTNGNTCTIGVPVTLSGTSTVDIDGGTLRFGGGVNVAAGATLDIDAGKTLEVTGGVFQFNSGTVSMPGSGTFKVSSGTLRIPTGITKTIPNVTIQGSGVIDGAGALHVSGNFNWLGGTIAGSGPKVLNSTSVPTISCSAGNCLLDGATLQLQAFGTYSASSNALVFSNGASLILDPGQTINVTNDGDFLSGVGAGGSIVIGGFAAGLNGCIWKTTTSGISTIGVPVTMSGSFKVDAGTLEVAADVTVIGTVAIVHYSAGATLEVTGGMFLFNSGPVSFPANGNFKVSSGTLRVATGVTLTIPNVTLQGSGIIDGAGDLHLSGNFSWLGGTIAGSGLRVLDSTSTPTISCSAGPCNLDTAALLMNASATFNATTNSLIFFNTASLVIASGKTLDITTDGTIVGTAIGIGTITNNGTITKSGGPGLRSISTVLNNNGSVIVTSGGLSLLGNGTHGGSFTVTAPGAMLFDGGAHTLAGGISGTGTMTIGGATVTLNSAGNVGGFTMSGGTLGGSGTLTLSNGGTWSNGTMTGSGTTEVAAGKTLTVSGFPTLNGRALDLGAGAILDITSQRLDVASAANVTGSGTVRVNGGTLRVLSGVTQTIPKLTLTTGVIDGAGALHVSGNFNWLGGTIAGSGARVLDSSSTPAISCSAGNCLLDGATLQLQASATTYSASSNALVISNGASLILDAGKGLDVINDGDFLNGGGAASSIVIGGPVAGFNALIRKWMTSGTSIIGVPVTMSGSFLVETGTLEVAAGVSIAAGAIIDYRPGAAIEVTGGVFLFNSSSVSFPFNGTFKVSAGTLRVPTGVTMNNPMPNVTLEGSGVIDGGGTLILSGTSTWAGGTMGSATAPGGITRINSGSTLNVTTAGTPTLTQSRILRNNGTLNLPAGGGIDLSGSATIENNGTIAKNTSGTSTIQPRVETSSGATVSAATGTIALSGGGTADGAYSISSGATLALIGGTFTMSGSPTVTGAGTLSIAGATLNAGAGVDLTWPNVTLSAGTITGAGAVRVSGNFNWSGGTLTGSGPRVLNSASVPAISCSSGNCLLDGATLQLQEHGTYSASGNALVLSNGASLILDPGKILFVTNDGDFVNGGGAASSINVGGFASGANGCIQKTTTTGTSIIDIPVTMSGSFFVDTGTMQIVADVTAATGAILHYSVGATLEITGGLFLLTSGVSFPANGDFKISGGTLRIPASVTLTARNVTLQGSGVIDGGGTLSLSGTSTWSAGTMSGSGTTVIPATMSLGISAPVTLSRTLQNDGTLSVSGDVTGSGTIDNGGTLNALADLTIGTVLNNSGQVVTSNALSLAGGGTHTGSFNVTTPGSIFFSAGTHSVSGGSIGGTGTLAISGASVTVSSPFTIGALSVSAGTATLDANGSADAFTMTGGTLGGSGTLTLTNGGTWSGGTMSGSGETFNPAAKTLNISSPVTLSSRTLQNDGTLSVSGDITGSGTIDNAGTLNAAADLAISAVVNNSGQVVTSNALSLAGGGTHTGLFDVAMPGILSFSAGTHSMSGGGSIGGTGTLTFNGATATVGVPVNVSTLSVTAGTATLDGNGSADAFTMTGGTLGGSGTLTLTNGGTWSGGTMSGSGTTINPATMSLGISAPVTLNSRALQNDGTLTVSADITGSGRIDNGGTLDAAVDLTLGVVVNNSGQVVTSNALSLAGGGTHTGSFTVTAPGNMAFTSGTHSMSGGGSLGGTGTLTFNGATATVGVPVNVGSLSISAGTATLNANGSADAFTMTGGTLGGSGVLTLNNGGTWSGGSMSGSGATVNPATKSLGISAPVTLNSRTLQNDGTLTVSSNVAGSGTIDNNGALNVLGNSAIGAALNNSGQIATSDLLSLGGNGAHAGTFTVTAPGVIDFSGGTQTISGTLAGTGTLRFSGAAATVNGTWTGMPIEVMGGSAALDTNGTIPALTLSGGTLAGSGDIIVTGPSTWSGGTIAGSGDFTFDTDATVTMPGTNPVTLTRGLLNRGTVNFAAASNGMLIDGARFRNNGTFDIQSLQAIAATAGTPSFVNGGTLKKSTEGVMQFDVPLSNSGQVRIETGTIQFGGNYAQSGGTTTIVSSAKLQADTLTLDGGSLTGNGTVVGTVANNATVSPGASPGTLTVSGDYVQSSDGVLNIQIDGTAPGTQYDRVLISGSVTLGGTLNVTTTNGFTPTPGNAFQILTFGSRTGASTFDVMNGLAGLVPTFSATDLKLVAQIIIPVAADVGVVVNGPGSTIAGTAVIYTVTVSNSGPDPAANIAVTATASPGLTFSGNSGACVGSFPCNIATLGSGQSAMIHTAWNIAPAATGSVQLTVNTSSAADPNSSNNSDSATTNIGTCPTITIVAPEEMTTGLTAQATATSFGGATYNWSIINGTIDSGDGTAGIDFTAGQPGTTSLAVIVTGGGCTLGATFDVTVKARCLGTAMPTAPADATVTADAVVDFSWTAVDDASGYRLWLEEDGAPARNLGTALGTSRTKIIPPGAYRWYVETLFNGCASHESERRALNILPAEDCASRGAPELSAPVHETQATSAAVVFSWNAVDQALEYELWLAPAGGVPTLIRTTSETSYTAVVPPGRLEWYVRAVFGGCASTESAHRVFTYTPPPHCTSERPLLIAPAEGERLTSPVSFEWTSVSGATSYELYVDGVLAATTTSPQASDLPLPRAERRWQVRARLGEGCGAVDSAESRLVVIASPPSCAPLGAPVISAPAQISSGIAGRIQWTFVAGATAYVVEISGDPQFPRALTSSTTVTTRQLPFTFTNQSSEPMARYVRVHAVDTDCVEPGRGAFSPVAVLSVLPPAGSATGSEGVALLSDPTDVQYTLGIAAEHAGLSFTATPTVPWISVTPANGIVPPGGQTLRAVAHSAGLPPGTNIGNVEITTTAAAGALTALATTPIKLTISLNNIPGVFTAPKSTPPPDALIIPAVANVTNFVVRYESDICATNTSAQVMRYEINFVPTGPAGMSEGQKTTVSLEPGATLAMSDIVATWFGGRTSTGTLEIRPLTEIDTSTSSAAVGGLAQRITFASSRTFSTTAAGGTYGQYVPAVPYANFVAMGTALSLQHIAQSDKYRTNLGLVEGSGEKVTLEVRIFDAAGTKRASFPVDLNGGERAQLNGVLHEHGVALDDGRIEVEVTSGLGKVTAYASVVENATNDSQIVPPVTLDHVGHGKWVVPGVADLVSGAGNWQTDVRIFNAGTEPAELTLSFYSMNGGPPTTRTITLAAGEVRQFDRVLSFFAIAGDAGALHIASAAPAQIVATARTYKQTDDGAYGQFIAAVTPEEAVAVGTRPLQILQMEESERFKSNIGFAEVSGKPVTLEVSVFRPNSTAPSLLEVKLEPNQFQQLNSLLASLGLGEMYNARISVRAIGGEGRALAYGSLIDHKTGDPTFIPGQ